MSFNNVQSFLNTYAPKTTVEDLIQAGFYSNKEVKPLTNTHELNLINMYATPEREVECMFNIEGVRVFEHSDSWGPECACLHPTLGWVVILNKNNPYYEVTLAHELGHILNASLGFFANKDEYLAWVTAEVEVLGRKLTDEEKEFKAKCLRTYGCVDNKLTLGVMANAEIYGEKQVNKFLNLFSESIRMDLVS